MPFIELEAKGWAGILKSQFLMRILMLISKLISTLISIVVPKLIPTLIPKLIPMLCEFLYKLRSHFCFLKVLEHT